MGRSFLLRDRRAETAPGRARRYLIPVTLASATTVHGFLRDGFHGTPPDWIRAFLLLSWLVPFGWLVVLLAT